MLTQEQFHDLKKYVPGSEMVKMVFSELHEGEEDFSDWDEAIQHLAAKAVGSDGDTKAFFDILELTNLNAHNEGALEAISSEESQCGSQ